MKTINNMLKEFVKNVKIVKQYYQIIGFFVRIENYDMADKYTKNLLNFSIEHKVAYRIGRWLS